MWRVDDLRKNPKDDFSHLSCFVNKNKYVLR